jgi:hypothetical protein
VHPSTSRGVMSYKRINTFQYCVTGPMTVAPNMVAYNAGTALIKHYPFGIVMVHQYNSGDSASSHWLLSVTHCEEGQYGCLPYRATSPFGLHLIGRRFDSRKHSKRAWLRSYSKAEKQQFKNRVELGREPIIIRQYSSTK